MMHTRGLMIIVALIGGYFGACRGVYRCMEMTMEWSWPWSILPFMFSLVFMIYIEVMVAVVLAVFLGFCMNVFVGRYKESRSADMIFGGVLLMGILVLCLASVWMGRWLEIQSDILI